MKCEEMGINQKPLSLKVPFNDKEQRKYRSFLKKYSLKSGNWVRTVILSAMAQEEAIRENRTQIEMSVFKPKIELYQEQEVQNDLS